MFFTKIRNTIAVFLVFGALFAVTSCDMPMGIIGGIPDPQDTVRTFFDSVCSGDFDQADRCLNGVSISMKKEIDGVFSKKLYDYLLRSYSYSILQKAASEQLKAKCRVEFTYLDLNLLTDDLKETSSRLGKKYIAENAEGYVETKDGGISLTDEGAEKTASEALDEIMQNPEKYYSTKTFDIDLEYDGKNWLINLSDGLFDAICGGFDSAE